MILWNHIFCFTFTYLAIFLQVIEQSGVIDAPGLCYGNVPSVVTTAVGQMVCAADVCGGVSIT